MPGQAGLQDAVALGMKIGKEREEEFYWLTSTNRGAAEVCEAALALLGITSAQLEAGYLPDPTTKSPLKIIARPGVILRLSRNLDKARGFVNGALATVVEALRGHAVFVAKLHYSGNYVLVHPMEEDGARFLPCCYGYATTIRRAQGVSISLGCTREVF